MNRRDFNKLSIAAAASLAGITDAGLKAEKPNFIFILADDLGWADLGCYGHPKVKTPNIDRLAEEGTRFTSFYVNSPVCSPTRAGLITGQFPSRHSMHTQLFRNKERIEQMKIARYLDPGAVMLPRLLKKSGYQTAHVGKWHLGVSSNLGKIPHPKEYGFDFVRSHHFDWEITGQKWDYQHSSELIVNQGISFLQQLDNKPFFMQLWFTDPHRVYNPTEKQLKAYPEMPKNDVLKKYWSVITEMDRQVGRLLKALEKLNLAKSTYVIFASDNGPVDPSDLSSNQLVGAGSAGPFRGTKGSLYEGGIRVPFIIRCPGKVPQNRIDEKTVISGVDILPTFCSLAGASLPGSYTSDGQDMSLAFEGKAQNRQKALMWFYPIRYRAATINQSPVLAIRDGKWKLLTNPDGFRIELYNLKTDITETNNLVEQYPEVAGNLKQKLMNWYLTLPPNTIEPGAGELTFPWPGKKWDAVIEKL